MTTKAQAIDKIYLAVHGGQPSPDVNVRRIDIAHYLVAAINYVLTSEIRARKREDRQLGMHSSGVDSEFLATSYLDVLHDDQRGLYYVVLSSGLASLPGNMALYSVSALQSEIPFTKIKDQFEDITVRRMMPNNTRYWHEKVGNQDRVYFNNISTTVHSVMVRFIASIDKIADNDPLPIPLDMEIQILSLARDWFTGQRQMPADMLNNNKDDKQ